MSCLYRHFASREEAMAAERNAVQQENPVHNKRLRALPAETKAARSIEAVRYAIGDKLVLHPLYRLPDAGPHIGVSTATIKQAIEAGRLGFTTIPSPRTGKDVVFISGWQLVDWLESCATPARKA